MLIFHVRFRRAIGFLTVLSAAALAGCSAANEPEDVAGSGSVDSVAQVSESVISGARVVQTFPSSVSVAPGRSFTVSPGCPSGVLVGAGFSTHSKTRVYASSPAGNSWSVSNFNFDTVSHNLSAELYCLTGTNATTTVTTTPNVNLRFNAIGCQVAACPAGSFAVNGGWNSGTSFEPYLSRPEGTGWAVCGKNVDIFSTIPFQASALCLRGVRGSAQVAVLGSTTIQPRVNGIVHGGPCATGQLVAGGMFNLTANGFQGVPFHTFRSSTRYDTEVRNPYFSDPITVAASTICLDLSP